MPQAFAFVAEWAAGVFATYGASAAVVAYAAAYTISYVSAAPLLRRAQEALEND